MPISGGYIFRETGGNFRRNLLMTVAAIVTMAVSLTLVASALMMKQAIKKASVQWRGGVELSIFLQPGVTPNQQQALGHELNGMTEVKKVRFVDKPQAYDEFKQMFANTPDLVNSLTVNDMPPSYRVVPTKAEDINSIGQRFQSQPGVKEVVYAKEVIKSLLKEFDTRRKVAIFLAAAALHRCLRADRQHHPARHFRPPAGDRGHEAGRARPTGSFRSRSCWRGRSRAFWGHWWPSGSASSSGAPSLPWPRAAAWSAAHRCTSPRMRRS